MARRYSIRIFLLLLVAIAILIPSCHKEQFAWKPEVLLVMKPDSGLTTQTFDFRVDIPNLPTNQQEFFLRWDMNADSVWDAAFTACPTLSYRFYQKGSHKIRMEILTKDGQRLAFDKIIRVDQGFSAPHAAFTIDPPVGNFLTDFTFDASKTFDDEDLFSSLLFRWDFESDGSWDTEISSNPITKYRYKKVGTYTVRLSVTDPTRLVATETKTLEVNFHEDLIHPDFSWTPVEGKAKDTFLFDASATKHETDPDRIFTYTWDIKSEVTYGPFKEPLFNHVFETSGLQAVTMKATDQNGLFNSITKDIFVIKENKPPTPRILVPTPYGNIATNFWFSSWPSTDDVTGPSRLLVRWDFEGDGIWDTGWSYDKEVFHQFTTPGNYWVTLQAEDEGGERGIGKIKLQVTQYSNPTGFIQDRRDGRYYGTVKIGEQWWMSDNLNYHIGGKRNIGLLQKCYNQDGEMCDLYGALYQGERAVGYAASGQNICPDGWRLPTKADWLKLGEHIDTNAGKSALMPGGSLGFNAQYGGTATYLITYDNDTPPNPKDTFYYFKNLGQEARYLSITLRPFLNDLRSQFFLGFRKESEAVDIDWSDHDSFFSARCIKID